MTDEITREMFQHSTVVIAGLNDHIEALTAENERLREALQSVTPPPHFGESEQNKAWWAKARAALEEK